MSLKIKTLGLLTLFSLFAFNCSKKVTKGYDYSVFNKQVKVSNEIINYEEGYGGQEKFHPHSI